MAHLSISNVQGMIQYHMDRRAQHRDPSCRDDPLCEGIEGGGKGMCDE